MMLPSPKPVLHAAIRHLPLDQQHANTRARTHTIHTRAHAHMHTHPKQKHTHMHLAHGTHGPLAPHTHICWLQLALVAKNQIQSGQYNSVYDVPLLNSTTPLVASAVEVSPPRCLASPAGAVGHTAAHLLPGRVCRRDRGWSHGAWPSLRLGGMPMSARPHSAVVQLRHPSVQAGECALATHVDLCRWHSRPPPAALWLPLPAGTPWP